DQPRATPLDAPPDRETPMTDRADDRTSQDASAAASARDIAVSTDGRRAPAETTARAVRLRDVNAWYGETHAIKGVSLDYEPNQVTAMIGPSGCGKSTLVRCINRMHEEIPGARAR